MLAHVLSYRLPIGVRKQFGPLQIAFFGVAAALASVSQTVSAGTTPERQCYEMVQGNVAWNQNGNKRWVDQNIQSLCAGTTAPQRRIGCFKRGIRVHNDWNRAITDCKSRDEVARTPSNGRRAVGITRSPMEQCRNDVQGNIAWNREGNKRWRAANLDRFCTNTTMADTARRIECFEQAISSHGDWSRGITSCTNPSRRSRTVERNNSRDSSCEERVQGRVAWNREGITRWGADNLEAFCDGVASNYLTLRINCFESEVQTHNDWRRALDSCRSVGRTAGRVSPTNPEREPSQEAGSDSRQNADSHESAYESARRQPHLHDLHVSVKVVAIEAIHGDDGGSDNTFEYYTKTRIKEGFDWDASSVEPQKRPLYRNNRIRSGSNGFSPDRAMLPTRQTAILSKHFESPWPEEKFKVHISLWDYDEASDDDWFDINPASRAMDGVIYVDAKANQIRMRNADRRWVVVGGNGDLITLVGAGDRGRYDEQSARIKFIIRWAPIPARRTSLNNN